MTLRLRVVCKPKKMPDNGDISTLSCSIPFGRISSVVPSIHAGMPISRRHCKPISVVSHGRWHCKNLNAPKFSCSRVHNNDRTFLFFHWIYHGIKYAIYEGNKKLKKKLTIRRSRKLELQAIFVSTFFLNIELIRIRKKGPSN